MKFTQLWLLALVHKIIQFKEKIFDMVIYYLIITDDMLFAVILSELKSKLMLQDLPVYLIMNHGLIFRDGNRNYGKVALHYIIDIIRQNLH